MKYMNAKKKYQSLNLQLFAGEEDGGDGGDAGDDDSEEGSDDDDPDDDDPDEKKFSQKDVDAAVKKRLEREKRKWKRDQQKKTSIPDGRGKAGDDDKRPESEDEKARKAAEDKVSGLEMKVACYEAGVDKDAVDDVAALARSYMAADDDLDLEDAIEKVVKKYPQFKKVADPDVDNDDKGKKEKSWAQRQSGKGAKKLSGVEARFYELNPDLKK